MPVARADAGMPKRLDPAGGAVQDREPSAVKQRVVRAAGARRGGAGTSSGEGGMGGSGALDPASSSVSPLQEHPARETRRAAVKSAGSRRRMEAGSKTTGLGLLQPTQRRPCVPP